MTFKASCKWIPWERQKQSSSSSKRCHSIFFFKKPFTFRLLFLVTIYYSCLFWHLCMIAQCLIITWKITWVVRVGRTIFLKMLSRKTINKNNWVIYLLAYFYTPEYYSLWLNEIFKQGLFIYILYYRERYSKKHTDQHHTPSLSLSSKI